MSLERLEALRGEMKKCVRCSLCKLVPMPTIQDARFTSACPPVDEYKFHAYSGGGMQVMALALLDGRIAVDQDLANIAAACTTCGACDVSCKFIMAAERLDVIMALKEHLVECGQALPTQQVSPGDRAGEPALPLGGWAEGLRIKKLPEESAPLLLFAGAGACQDGRHAASARRLARLLQEAGVDFGALLGDELPSGIEQYWTGQQAAFTGSANHLVDLLDRCQVETIVTLCGEDLGMLRAKYPAANRAPRARVLHASQLLLSLLQSGKLQLPRALDMKVTYHDPCYLGRQSEPPQPWEGEECLTHGVMRYFSPPKPINYGTEGVFEAPRQVLRMIPGLELHEMQRIREYAYCCGGGGGVPDAHPAVARNAALGRLQEARATGAQCLVSACQHCRHNLTRWQQDEALPAGDLPVVDLVDLVYQASGLDESDLTIKPGAKR